MERERACRWLRGPALDRVMVWSWVPFAALVLVVRPGAEQMVGLLGLLLAFSFSHQTLTLPLVYGDRQVMRTHPRLFSIAPFLALATIGLLIHSGLVLLIAAVGAAWNAEHTLMQRFGIMRIYGRQVGQDDAGVELPLLFVWFFITLAAVAARGADAVGLRDLFQSGVNHHTVEFLDSAQPVGVVILVPLVAAGAALLAMWCRQEFGSGRRLNRAKHEYLLSTAALFAVAVVNPVAGLLGFVGSHAVEYYIVVDKTARTRYGASSGAAPSPLARLGASRVGHVAPGVLYVIAVVAFAYAWRDGQPRIYSTIVLSIGALHFTYDSFIWKLRKPATAASLDIGTAAPVPAPSG